MIYVKLILMAIFWGLSFVAGKVATEELPIFTAAFYRFATAYAILLLISVTTVRKIITDTKHFFLCSLTGATGIFLYNLFFLSGLSITQASKASIIITINPALIAIFAFFVYKERLNMMQMIGIAIAFCGVIIVIIQGDLSKIRHFAELNNGDILILGAGLSWSAYSLIGRKLLTKITPFECTCHSVFWGTLFLTPFFIMDNYNGMHLGNMYTWLSIFELSALATVAGFIFFYQGIKTIGTAKAAAFIYTVPIFGTISGITLLGEEISYITIVGGLTIICGVYMVNKKYNAKAR